MNDPPARSSQSNTQVGLSMPVSPKRTSYGNLRTPRLSRNTIAVLEEHSISSSLPIQALVLALLLMVESCTCSLLRAHALSKINRLTLYSRFRSLQSELDLRRRFHPTAARSAESPSIMNSSLSLAVSFQCSSKPKGEPRLVSFFRHSRLEVHKILTFAFLAWTCCAACRPSACLTIPSEEAWRKRYDMAWWAVLSCWATEVSQQ